MAPETLVAAAAATTLPDRTGRPVLGLSTDSMTERDLAAEAVRRTRRPVTAFSAAALCGQDELVEELKRFGTENELSIYFHALDLDLAGIDPVDPGMVRQIAEYARELGSPWITTDFAMWVLGGEKLIENMVPVPLTAEAVDWVADRTKLIQDIAQMPVVGENPPYPVLVGDLDILTLMGRIAERADCGLCMDIGHLYILRRQRGLSVDLPEDADFPWERVVEAHVSGITCREFGAYELVQDQHKWPVDEPVWRTAEILMPKMTRLQALIGESEGMRTGDLVAKLERMDDCLEAVTW
ncbi:multinuclear nonheme iron-dependent oxidase [Streptomyces sp. NPDC003042]